MLLSNNWIINYLARSGINPNVNSSDRVDSLISLTL